MSVTDRLLANNAVYADNFNGPLPLPPARGVAVIACMDARLNVYAILGLAEGEAHVIRNAGGVVTDDEIRSLAISQRLLGTREIILIHHTDCGMLTFTDDDFKAKIQAETGIKPPGQPSPSPTSKPTSTNPWPASTPAPSSPTSTPSAASSSTWPRASCPMSHNQNAALKGAVTRTGKPIVRPWRPSPGCGDRQSCWRPRQRPMMILRRPERVVYRQVVCQHQCDETSGQGDAMSGGR